MDVRIDINKDEHYEILDAEFTACGNSIVVYRKGTNYNIDENIIAIYSLYNIIGATYI